MARYQEISIHYFIKQLTMWIMTGSMQCQTSFLVIRLYIFMTRQVSQILKRNKAILVFGDKNAGKQTLMDQLSV